MLEKVHEQVVATLQGYVARFPEIKARIAKRERRALDYERTKRALEKARENQVKPAVDALCSARQCHCTPQALCSPLPPPRVAT